MATDLGDVIRLTYNDLMPDGVTLANATTVTLTITLPDGSTVSPTVTNPPTTTGVYIYDYLTTQSGRHTARWVATGTNPGAQSQSFNVLALDPGYIVPLDDIKDQLDLSNTLPAEDEELRKYLGAASAIVESLTGRTIVQRSFTEELTVSTVDQAVILSHIPVASVSSVAKVDDPAGATWTGSQVHVEPSGRMFAMNGNPSLSGNVTVTYTAGQTVIPDTCILATAFIVQHLWRTHRGAAGGFMPGMGGTAGDDTVTVAGFSYAVPRKVIEILGAPLPGVA
ncbi:head-tail connector protein [Sinomonas sp.]|uniref:head-tail connector protein n=1 Tax=Sinomonas sp. TaxID=1914986 RepID=UPI003F7EA058